MYTGIQVYKWHYTLLKYLLIQKLIVNIRRSRKHIALRGKKI